MVAFAEDLAERPIVPTYEQELALDTAWMKSKRDMSCVYHKCEHATAFGAIEWQRRMFIATDPEEVNQECNSFAERAASFAPKGVDRIELNSNNVLVGSHNIEPKVPEEIKDLLALNPHEILSDSSVDAFNDSVLEAYRRGQKARTA